MGRRRGLAAHVRVGLQLHREQGVVVRALLMVRRWLLVWWLRLWSLPGGYSRCLCCRRDLRLDPSVLNREDGEGQALFLVHLLLLLVLQVVQQLLLMELLLQGRRCRLLRGAGWSGGAGGAGHHVGRRLWLRRLRRCGRLVRVRRGVLGAYEGRVLEGVAFFVWLRGCLGRGVGGIWRLRPAVWSRASGWFVCRVG